MTIVPRSVSTTACLLRISSRESGVVKNCGAAGLAGAGFGFAPCWPACHAITPVPHDIANASNTVAVAGRRAVMREAIINFTSDVAAYRDHHPPHGIHGLQQSSARPGEGSVPLIRNSP